MKEKLTGFLISVLLILFVIFPCYSESNESRSYYEGNKKELNIYDDIAYVSDTFQISETGRVGVLLPQTTIPRTIQIFDNGEEVDFFYFIEKAPVESKDILPSNMKASQIAEWQSKSKEPGTTELHYLLKGIHWSPFYELRLSDDGKAVWYCKAAITNNDFSLSNANVKLFFARSGQKQHTISQASSISSGETDKYDLGVIERLEKGIIYKILLKEVLNTVKTVQWKTSEGENLNVLYKIQNSSNFPFNPGIVDIYYGNIFLGSENLGIIPAGKEGQIKIKEVTDLNVKKNIKTTKMPERKNSTPYYNEVELKITNNGPAEINIIVIDNKNIHADYVDLVFSVKPKEEDMNCFKWETKVKSKDTKYIRYDFYSNQKFN